MSEIADFFRIFEPLGILIELIGSLYAISYHISPLWSIINKTSPFLQINRGLAKINPENYDIPFQDKLVSKEDEGYDEIFKMLDDKYNFHKEFDNMHIGADFDNAPLYLTKYNENGDREYQCMPTTRIDFLYLTEKWIESELIKTGFATIAVGALLQLIGVLV